MILLVIRKGQTDHPSMTKVMRVHSNCSFESKLKLVDFDIHDEFLKFTDSYDAWMNRHEYEDQKLSDRHPFTVQQFSEEFSAILAKQIVQKGTDSEILSLVMTPSLDMRYPEQHFNGQLPASIPCTKHEH